MSTCTKHFPPKNVLLDLDTLAVRKLSKSQLATLYYPPEKFTLDYGLPQLWLESIRDRSGPLARDLVCSTTVWIYPDKSEAPLYWLSGLPAALCEDTAKLFSSLNMSHWTPTGFFDASLIKE